jgi:hypothetical protein
MGGWWRFAALTVVAAFSAATALDGCTTRPPGLEDAEPLAFDVVLTSSANLSDGESRFFPQDETGAWVIQDDQELAGYWAAGGGNVDSVLGSKLGDPPRVPDQMTALLVIPGVTLSPKNFQVSGVFDRLGAWTVVVRHDEPKRVTNSYTMGSRIPSWVVLVDAPPPDSVRMLIDDRTQN